MEAYSARKSFRLLPPSAFGSAFSVSSSTNSTSSPASKSVSSPKERNSPNRLMAVMRQLYPGKALFFSVHRSCISYGSYFVSVIPAVSKPCVSHSALTLPLKRSTRLKKSSMRSSDTPASESSLSKSCRDARSFRFVYSTVSAAGRCSAGPSFPPQPASAETISATQSSSAAPLCCIFMASIHPFFLLTSINVFIIPCEP